MKPSSFLMGSASINLLVTSSLLLLFVISVTPDNFTKVKNPSAKKICHQLIDDQFTFIIAIGFAEDEFIIVTNDYTTIVVQRTEIQCTTKQCTVNLVNAEAKRLSAFEQNANDKSFPDKDNYYAAVIISSEWKENEIYPEKSLFLNRGQSGRITYISRIRLNTQFINETTVKVIPPVVVPAKPVFFSVDSNHQFLIQNGTELHLCSYNQNGPDKMVLSINWIKPIGRIALLDDLKTGFLVNDTLVALSNSRKSIFLYPMGTDTVTQPSSEVSFSDFFDCEGKMLQEDEAHQQQTGFISQLVADYGLKSILIGTAVVAIALLALGLVIWSFMKSNQNVVKKPVKK